MKIVYFANPCDNHDCKWINEFAKSHQVHIVCSQTNSAGKLYVENDSIRIHSILPDVFPYKNPIEYYLLKQNLLRFFRDNQIEIAHSMYAYPNAFYPYITSFKNHIITTRGSDVLMDYSQIFKNPNNLKERFIYGYLRKMMEKSLSQAAFITSTSHSQRNIITQTIADEEKSLVIRTGIDTHLLDKFQQKFTKQQNDKLVVFSPRSMKPIYNIEIILEGFYFVKTRFNRNDFELVLLDDYPDTEYSKFIKNEIQRLRLEENVILLGSQSLEQMVGNYVNSDLAVMMPKSDGTPNTALEAMFFKRPLILGSLKYDTDIFNNQTIWKLNKDTAQEFAAVLLQWWNSDESQISEKVNNAFEAMYSYASLDKSLAQIEGLYQKLGGEK